MDDVREICYPVMDFEQETILSVISKFSFCTAISWKHIPIQT